MCRGASYDDIKVVDNSLIMVEGKTRKAMVQLAQEIYYEDVSTTLFLKIYKDYRYVKYKLRTRVKELVKT